MNAKILLFIINDIMHGIFISVLSSNIVSQNNLILYSEYFYKYFDYFMWNTL